MSAKQSTRATDLKRRDLISRAALIASAFLGGARFAPVRAQALNELAGGGPEEDRAAILGVLQDYLRVTDKRDEASIAKAFDPVATLMSVTKSGEVLAMSQATWWTRVSRIPAGAIDRRSVVRIIDVSGRAAIARVDLSSGGPTFTDYFNLLRTRDGWRIVNKALSSPLG